MTGMLLVGCAENPALIGEAPEASESNDNSADTETANERKVVDSPPTVQVANKANDESTHVALDIWCWKEESLCSLEPNPPEEQLYGWKPLPVEPGEIFNFMTTTDEIPETDHIYSPDIIELTQIRLGEKQEVEVNGRDITAPMEKGKYYYSLKLQWDGEVVGQAYYVFSILVR